MPSGPEKKENTAGDMAPFIIFMAFVILTTVIVISIYRIRSEINAASGLDDIGLTIKLDAREPVVFSKDFLFPGFHPASDGNGRGSRPDIRQDVIEARRLIADEEYAAAEDLLRTLLLFYPDDVEIICLMSGVLHATGRSREAQYYDDRMNAPAPRSAQETHNPAPGTQEKRTST